MFESEGLEHQGQPLARLGLDELADPLAQGVGFQAAGIDAMAQAGDGFKQQTFTADSFIQRLPGAGHWVPAAGFGIAFEQCFFIGVQKQEGRAHAIFRQPGEAVRG